MFFRYCKTSFRHVDWDHSDLVKSISYIGEALPWSHFTIYFLLPDLPNDLHIAVQFHMRLTLLKKVAQTTKTNIASLMDSFEEREFLDCDEKLSSDSDTDELTIKKNISLVLQSYIQLHIPRKLQDAIVHPLIILGDQFRKIVTPAEIGNTLHSKLQFILRGAKLGLPFDILQSNPSFYQFAIKNALHRYLFILNHELRYNASENTIQIMFEDRYRDWSEVQGEIIICDKDPLVMNGQYSSRGIVNESATAWKTLEPFIVLNPGEQSIDCNKQVKGRMLVQHDWGCRYVLEICSWIIEKPRLAGDHMWMRLKTPKGEVYSFGLYRERKIFNGGFPGEQVLFPMKVQRCEFQSPGVFEIIIDICEFWGGGSYSTLSMEITV
jgi:hypothetical protein